ncbi:hypothetical protein [Salana multivorans]|uniref:hypothetical protein n=1 Tax=Salana multivorans TaxID=120377 RepID=UPI0011CDB44A|nr:hypothetical protein [Salana multivorans]
MTEVVLDNGECIRLEGAKRVDYGDGTGVVTVKDAQGLVLFLAPLDQVRYFINRPPAAEAAGPKVGDVVTVDEFRALPAGSRVADRQGDQYEFDGAGITLVRWRSEPDDREACRLRYDDRWDDGLRGVYAPLRLTQIGAGD